MHISLWNWKRIEIRLIIYIIIIKILDRYFAVAEFYSNWNLAVTLVSQHWSILLFYYFLILDNVEQNTIQLQTYEKMTPNNCVCNSNLSVIFNFWMSIIDFFGVQNTMYNCLYLDWILSKRHIVYGRKFFQTNHFFSDSNQIVVEIVFSQWHYCLKTNYRLETENPEYLAIFIFIMET